MKKHDVFSDSSSTLVDDAGSLSVHKSTEDPCDIVITSEDAQNDRYFHLERESAKTHLTLRRGASPSQPVAAWVKYDSFNTGTAYIGDAEGAKDSALSAHWQQTPMSNFADFIVDGRKLRLLKTYQSKRRKLAISSSRYLEWQLQDLSTVDDEQLNKIDIGNTEALSKIGTLLATLSLDGVAKSMSAKPSKKYVAGEMGTMHWIVPTDEDLRDLTTLAILALYHRDRAVQNREKLHPHADFEIPKRTMAAGMGIARAAGFASGPTAQGVGYMAHPGPAFEPGANSETPNH